MAEAEKRKPIARIYTPKGTAVFPRLTEPDTKFNADGLYQTRLRMTVDEGAELMAQLDKMVNDKYDEAIAANGGKTFKIVKGKKTEIVKNEPYSLVLDDDGNETGDVEFKFKMYAKVTDKKTQKQRSQRPTLVDGKGNEIKKRISIYGGSIIKINCTPSIYDKSLGIGVTLYLNAVQILKLVSGGHSHGFGADEESEYEYEDTGAGGFDDESDNSDNSDSSEDDDQEF